MQDWKNNIIQKSTFRGKTKKTKIKTKIGYLLIILVSVGIFTIPLVHKLFPKKNRIVELYKKELEKEVDSIDKELVSYREKYDNGNISAENYIEINDILSKRKEEIILRNKKLIKLKVDKERFFGWKTIRKFYVGLGVRLPFLFMSIIISFLIFKLETKDKYLKRALFFLQTSCYGLSFYYMLWVFWYSQDYSIVAYRWFFIAFSLSSAAATVYFISYRNVFVSNLETKLKGVVSYILEIRTKHFPKMAINSLEVDEEATIKGINQFELRTVEELEKIAK